ncbi:MAG: Holliday junction resolvase RuvX [bacterium]|nr:MAG: Holliday junction resolvase RuvX [bacterium]
MEEPGARILGIDPGTKRTGIAVSDPLGVTAQGLETFVSGGGITLLDHLRSVVGRYGVGLVVVGMPLSMSGGEIEGTERSRRLAEEIRTELDIEVALRDERMTSREAERLMQRSGGVREKGDIDRIAAVLLLQGYLDERDS